MVFDSITEPTEGEPQTSEIIHYDQFYGEDPNRYHWDDRLSDRSLSRSRSRSRSQRRDIQEVQEYHEVHRRGVLDLQKWPKGYFWHLLALGGTKRYWTIVEPGEGEYPGTWTVWWNEDGTYQWWSLQDFLEW